MTNHCWVTTNTGDEDTAARLASSAIETKLAAAAQVIGPITNFFLHHGKAQRSEGWQVVFKTTMEHYDEVEKLIIEEHSLDNPEMAVIPLEHGSKPYLRGS